MSHESALIRRSSAACLIVICRYSRYPMANIRFLITFAIGKISLCYFTIIDFLSK